MSHESASGSTAEFEPGTDVVPAIVEAVAAATDQPVEELQPLADVVDPDALSTLFDARDVPEDLEVRFTYEGIRIVVSGTGEVWLQDSIGKQ